MKINSKAALKQLPIGTALRLVKNPFPCDKPRIVHIMQTNAIGFMTETYSVSWFYLDQVGRKIEGTENGFRVLQDGILWGEYEFYSEGKPALFGRETGMNIKLTGEQYLTIKALFKSASSDLSRISLSYVMYDHVRNWFVATDGHIIRMHKFPDFKNPESFLLSIADFQKTIKELKESGPGFLKKSFEVPIANEPARKYPNYFLCLPFSCGNPRETALNEIGIDFDLFTQFRSSFYIQPSACRMRFSSALGMIYIYAGDVLVGGIMPTRMFKDFDPEPLV